MKIRICSIILVGILLLTTAGCANRSTQAVSDAPASPESGAESEYADIYISVLDSYFPYSATLQDGIQYIAIDRDTLENATESDWSAISDFFRDSYEVDVVDASMADLQEQGLVKEGNTLDGILLSIESVDAGQNSMTIVGSKHRSGTGACGFESKLTREDGEWVLESTEMRWIA